MIFTWAVFVSSSPGPIPNIRAKSCCAFTSELGSSRAVISKSKIDKAFCLTQDCVVVELNRAVKMISQTRGDRLKSVTCIFAELLGKGTMRQIFLLDCNDFCRKHCTGYYAVGLLSTSIVRL